MVVVGKGVPSNLLHNISHESSALAEVALGARDTGLHLTRGDLLYTRKPGQPLSMIPHSLSLPFLDILFFFILLHSGAAVGFGWNVRGPC